MENIELVIKIPNEIRLALINNNQLLLGHRRSCDSYIKEAIINGTVIPKGHGDLIDRGKLKTHFIGTEQGTDLEVYLEPTIINAPTIIGADKESEE